MRKIIFIIFTLILIIFSLTFLYFTYREEGIEFAQAGVGDNVEGFAWNDNYGWVSLNTIDCDTNKNDAYDIGDTGPVGCPIAGTPFFNYGVNIDSGTGVFSGYAWSNNVGWIIFEKASVCNDDISIFCEIDQDCIDAGASGPCGTIDPNPLPDSYNFNINCDNPSDCDGVGDNCTACYNSTDNNIYGWAKILSLGDDGWIKFSDASWVDGVGVDLGTGDFSGWAWNGSGVCDFDGSSCNSTPCNGGGTCNTENGIGWISFNSIDCDTNNANGFVDVVCGGNDDATTPVFNYKVIATDLAPVKPTNVIVSKIPYSCTSLRIDWDAILNIDYYEVYREVPPHNPAWYPLNLAEGTELLPNLAGNQYDDTGLIPPTYNPGDRVYYKVRAHNAFGFSAFSDEASEEILAVCQTIHDNTETYGICPDTIQVSWEDQLAAEEFEINRCQCSSASDCSNCLVLADFMEVPAGDCNRPDRTTASPVSNPRCDGATCNCHDSPVPDPLVWYSYMIRAVDINPPDPEAFGEPSAPTAPIQSCPGAPEWKEVK